MFANLEITEIAWMVTTASEFALVAVMVWRRFYRSHLAFFLYVILALCQSLLGYEVYRIWGIHSLVAAQVIWSSQIVLICARGAAVFEVARQILQKYVIIWRTGRRMMIAVACLVLGYSLLFSGKQYYAAIENADRGMELAVAAVVVTLLLMARYYGVVISTTNRMLCMGFCLYSCAFVINFTLFETRLLEYAQLWNFLNIVIYVATVFLWIKAVDGARETVMSRSLASASPLGEEKLSAEARIRLSLLDNQLKQNSQRRQKS